MPVIRISDQTWDRLKVHARPLEDSVDDVVNNALDALDQLDGVISLLPKEKKAVTERPKGKKTPQKDFRKPLLIELLQLSGGAHVSEIRKKLEPKLKNDLLPADFEPVSNGDPRWWNAVCWERSDMVKDGLLRSDSQRGVWELSSAGVDSAKKA